jgi:hypothetical protein
MRLPLVSFVITYVSPLFILGILISWFYQTFSAPRAGHKLRAGVILLGMGGLMVLLLVMVLVQWPRMRQRAMLYARDREKEAHDSIGLDRLRNRHVTIIAIDTALPSLPMPRAHACSVGLNGQFESSRSHA